MPFTKTIAPLALAGVPNGDARKEDLDRLRRRLDLAARLITELGAAR